MVKKCDDKCDCGCDDNFDTKDTIYVTVEDGSEIECSILGVFEVDDKEYIALLSLEEEQVLLYGYMEDEEEFELIEIESDDEFDKVSEIFYDLFVEDDYDLVKDEKEDKK